MTTMAGINLLDHQYVGPAWYLSALFIMVLVLYPLMLRMGRGFGVLAAPLALLCYGNILAYHGCLCVSSQWNGWCMEGLLRAAGGISVGSLLCLAVPENGRQPTKSGGRAVAALELGLLVCWSLLVNIYRYDKRDILALLLSICIFYLAVRFEDIWGSLFNGRITRFLGNYSLTLFLVQTACVWLGAGFWPTVWQYKWLAWMVLANALSLLVHGLLALIRPALAALGRKTEKYLFG